MSEAGTYRCPTCGGPTDQNARRCEFCAAPVATVRCGRCFHMNPFEARHCSGCGHELGLEPQATASDRTCSGCGIALTELRSESGSLFDCAQCGGQFVEHRLLRALLERRQVVGRAGLGPTSLRANPLAAKVVYRPCPECRALMNRKNFGVQSGVIVDVCTRHGTWFDSGELPRVLAFVETGGLERAHTAEKERRQQERVALRTPTSSATPLGIYGPDEFSKDWTIARELLSFVFEQLKR